MPPLSQVNAEDQIYKVELYTLSFAEIGFDFSVRR